MLPPLTQQRIIRKLPDSFPLRYRNPNTMAVEAVPLDYDVQRYTEDFENEPGATTLIIQPTAESMVRTDDTPLDEYLGYEADRSGEELALSHVEGERLYDEWTCTVTATGQGTAETPGGQPFGTLAGSRVRALTFELKEFFSSRERLERSRLYEPGGPGEMPVRPEVVSGGGDVSAEFDDLPQERRVFVARLNYTLTRPVAVQYAEFFDVTIEQRA